MEISSILEIRPGITSIIGSGGKTTLMYTLAQELKARGRVILSTSTHIRNPEQYEVVTEADPARVRSVLDRRGAVCVGTPCEENKLSTPRLPWPELAALADYVLVEADGAHGLPLKAHASYEPVLPEASNQTILVAGADGFGFPIREVCHRPAIYAARADTSPDSIVTPTLAARVIRAEGFGDRIYINKAESSTAQAKAGELAALLPIPSAAGSLWEGVYECL